MFLYLLGTSKRKLNTVPIALNNSLFSLFTFVVTHNQNEYATPGSILIKVPQRPRCIYCGRCRFKVSSHLDSDAGDMHIDSYSTSCPQ